MVASALAEIAQAVPLPEIGGGSVALWFVWMLFTGRLVTRRAYDEMRQDRDHYREAHRVSEEARTVLAERNHELLTDVAKTIIHTMNSLPAPDARPGDSR